MRCSREGMTFRSHLLHLSIDFSGRKGGRPVPDGMQGRWLAWYGWTSPLLLQPCTFLKEPSPRPRTGIKFNCLPVAFGRVRNREEQLFRSSGLVVPSKRDVTSRRVAFLLRSSVNREEAEEEEEEGEGEDSTTTSGRPGNAN